MRIVADELIPYANEAFADLGEVVLVPGRKIDREAVKNADVLLVRSITRVDGALLEGSAVRFLGTATIGMDHIDRAYVESAGITFASAAGSNANSVSEYVVAALLHVAEQTGTSLAGQTVGVVGVGNVGSKVAAKCEALGMKVLRNDPPRQRAELTEYIGGGTGWSSLAAVLYEADVVTVHTPLARQGPEATFHLFDHDKLMQMKPGALLINTSRGPVVDNAALVEVLSAEGPLGAAVLDVWEPEPDLRLDLLERVALGTAHIAGYSQEGKLRATEMIYEAVCAFAGITPTWKPPYGPPPVPRIKFPAGLSDQAALHEVVRAVFDIAADDAKLRKYFDLSPEEYRPYFDGLRKKIPDRREFHCTQVTGDIPPAVRETLRGLGFRVD